MNYRLLFAALGTLLLLPLASASAQGRPPVGDWQVSLGAIGLYLPEYEGADEYAFKAFPSVDITWRDQVFLNVRQGLGAYFYRGDKLRLGASVGYTFGRDEDDSADLDGLGDINDGATANLLARWKVGKVSLDARYEQQITGADTGAQTLASLGYGHRLGPTMLRPALMATWASDAYMQDYFGISPSQAASSGLPTHTAEAGLKSVGARLMIVHPLGRGWGLTLLANYHRLLGDAADSPLVKDENQYFTALGIAYTF
ncbi:MAG: MipA/OmpV family protein [Desulfuromonadales bacterium]|nr:MipA/OmpV family protein [Desulfuromonadales bacterium]MDW7758554.1 MipA/OmpV family protein [Desulfuromonadales bacterium]